VGVHPTDAAAGSNAGTDFSLRSTPGTAKIAWQKRLPYSECEGSGGALTTAGGLMFHSEPDGVFQAYDAKTGNELWRFQTGEVGLGGGAGPSGAAAMTYESQGVQYVALANNRAVWAFKIGGAVPPRPAPTPPDIVRPWTGRIEDTASFQLGAVRTFNIASAGKRIDWLNDYDLSPTRARRLRAARRSRSRISARYRHTIAARDGSWRIDGPIKAGESGSVTITKAGTYEYILHGSPVDDWAACRGVTREVVSRQARRCGLSESNSLSNR
jgi:hypothetical protein